MASSGRTTPNPSSQPNASANTNTNGNPPTSNGSAQQQDVLDPVTHANIRLPSYSSSNSSLVNLNATHNDPSDAHLRALADAEAAWADNARKNRIELAGVAGAASFVGGSAILAISAILGRHLSGWSWFLVSGCAILGIASAAAGSILHSWAPRSPPIQLDGAESQLHQQMANAESAVWFNNLLRSLWPIVNPSLFISVADMLEDALKASLPSFIQGVRVADIGQGSQSIEIVNVRGLDVAERDGGDFVNLEVLLSYRELPHGKSLRDRSGNAHILMEFMLTGGVVVPVWVELTGLKLGARMRIQLMPNPPFLSAMVLTLLGKPKVNIKLTPMNKHLNVMDIPVLSGWLQSAIDTAVAGYVAPHSMNLDLKTMLSGREAMDTDTMGVVVIIVKAATGFRNGDGGKIWDRGDRHGDPYVSAGWGKWGKALWSTRIIENEGNPFYHEVAYLLIGPSELNAKEKLRLQLWDSDRTAADDLLGTVEVNLSEIMEGSQTLNKMSSRSDPFTDINQGKEFPGRLEWDCGYFAKTSLEQNLELLDRDLGKLREEVSHQIERELREADSLQHSGKADLEQQKKMRLKDVGDEIVAGAPPSEKWPSGILSIYIEQIEGLAVPHPRKTKIGEAETEEDGDDLPSAYATIMLNHQRVYRTRTKLKTSKPFFAAGTERFIKDWRTAQVIIAVRDQRQHENDPIIGVVVLPIRTILDKRSQVSGSYPISGGVGYGRIQISLIFRSVQSELPRSLTGWDIGTLDIQPSARAIDGPALPADLASCKLVLRTINGKGKLHAQQTGGWKQNRDKPVRLAVKRRYGECLLVEFRRSKLGPDRTAAFCTFWLKDLVDDEETTVQLPIWRNDKNALDRARVNAQEPEGAERVGTLELKLRLWPGLSGYHKPLASSDASMADVIKALDAAEETLRGDGTTPNDSLYDDGDSSDSSVSDGDEPDKVSSGKTRRDDLHRQHRGLMQWGAARKLAWLGQNVEEAKDGLEAKVKSRFKHQQADPGMDVEA
ncbi:Meiotically up-regulated 190 protein [Mycena kentingensis (nom. inval.)]|nr:Meiotically up-regulated 190 protein [Mycena kentingensis (nom. inval.)]